MGASFSYRVYETADFKRASKFFHNDQQDDRHENGNSYSGGIGMLEGVKETGEVFENEEDAEEYICDKHQKWSSALAVKFKRGKVVKSSLKQRDKLQEKADKVRESISNLQNQFAEEIQKAKSKFRACTKCNSKINRDFIPNANCPVCGESMYSNTQNSRIAKLEAKLHEIHQAHQNFKPKVKDEKVCWMIGGWCSE